MEYIWLQEKVILKDRYKIEKELSVSDLSIVYLADDMLCNCRCIVKEYYPKGKVLRDMDGKTVVYRMPTYKQVFEDEVEIFLNEGEILKECNHKNIVKYVDGFKENDTGYIVLEFCEGKTLDKHMKDENEVSIKEVLKDLFLPLIDAVEHIHKKGVIHRDIKPANIIINKDKGPVLIDFGSAINYKKDKNSKIFFTTGFSPVEFYSKEAKKGKFSDIYSVAATFYYYLTGITPQKSPDRLAGDCVEDLGSLNEEVSKFYSKIIMKNLSIDHRKRFSNVKLLKLFTYFEYLKHK
ncbi:MAG: serine/threonine-protein kinase [Bacillota bacterium]|nr:serine/threonine-protein kinase [Bacillota bacterium]